MGKLVVLDGYRQPSHPEPEEWQEPAGRLSECPYCEQGPSWNHWEVGQKCDRTVHGVRCDARSRHYHKGVTDGMACGATTPWWRRLRRWCFRREPHLHQHCTRCGGRWTVLPADRAKLPP